MIFMYSYFLIQLLKRVIRIVLSYVSWQSNEMFITPLIVVATYVSLFILVLGWLL